MPPFRGWGLNQTNLMAVPQKPGGGFNRPSGGGFKPGGGGFNKGGFRGRFAPRKEAEHRINHFIRVPQVRLVGDNVEVGIYDTPTALKMAQEQALDLVEDRKSTRLNSSHRL